MSCTPTDLGDRVLTQEEEGIPLASFSISIPPPKSPHAYPASKSHVSRSAVAAEAGISLAAASRVLRDHGRISPEIRAKVKKAAETEVRPWR